MLVLRPDGAAIVERYTYDETSGGQVNEQPPPPTPPVVPDAPETVTPAEALEQPPPG